MLSNALPIVTSILGILITAYIAIIIKHSSSKEEAIDGIKMVVVIFILIAIFITNTFVLYHTALSDKPITRPDVILISISVSLYVLMIIAVLMLTFLAVINKFIKK